MRRLVYRILTGMGHTVQLAEDGVKGLAAYRRTHPDLVITDMVMPEAEGIETIWEIRREAPTVPIVAMTAHGDSYLRQAIVLGATASLEKPFQPDELQTLVDRLLIA